MVCKKGTLKKYLSRASPPYPSGTCKGKKKKGSDGIWYISSPDKRGTYRWKRIPSEKDKKGNVTTTTLRKRTKTKKRMAGLHTYKTHDNGGRPYRVEYNSTHFDIYALSNSEVKEDTLVLHGDYEQIWVGDNLLNDPYYSPKGQGKGNSILIRDYSGKYIFIGHRITLFEIKKDKLVTYYSPIGNNDVPYPYIVGQEYVYFMLENKRVPVEHMDLERDGYVQFYKEIPPNQKKPFRVKVIHTPSY